MHHDSSHLFNAQCLVRLFSTAAKKRIVAVIQIQKPAQGSSEVTSQTANETLIPIIQVKQLEPHRGYRSGCEILPIPNSRQTVAAIAHAKQIENAAAGGVICAGNLSVIKRDLSTAAQAWSSKCHVLYTDMIFVTSNSFAFIYR